ncbi:hypothetical protein PHYC_01605 [Phycisphaerales bacterium]|nr:hypothetical protein PHYC_01605 [Phycisphaerales bacterium]
MKTRNVAAWAAAVLAVLASAVCRGQDVSEEAGPMAQIVPRRALADYAKILSLTPEQREQAADLHQGYRAALGEAKNASNTEMKALVSREADGHVDAKPRERQQLTLAFVKKAAALEKEFFDDLKSILTTEQMARFDRVERARRREVGFRFAFASGAGVDLLAVCDSVGVNREGPAGEVLDRYETEADRALQGKETTLGKVFERAMMSEDVDGDPKLIQELVGEIFGQAFRVRDINKRFAREIMPLLGDEERPKFEREVRVRSFPKVYRTSGVETLVQHARKEAGLPPDKLEELERLWTAYSREAQGANERLASAVEAREEDVRDRFMEMMAEAWGGPPKEGEMADAFKARKTLDETYLEKVRGLLTEDQRDKAPVTDPIRYQDVAQIMGDFDEERIKDDGEE